ncbi:Asp23/Gls24 family envelope stress response protein [Streptomyces sp. NPDC097619]|uniref:Asp23/Gls24 family envelope stress response protein n=1 Tax=Streptomyces sp. NPDC097619 TaxID=3157228 RepID=UPI00332E53AA
MAMNTPYPHDTPDDEPFETLACGRDLAHVWEQATEGADPHTATCVHCQSALADLQRLRAAALTPPRTPTTDTDSDTAALARRIMDMVRLELRPGRDLPLGDADEDHWIYESVAARLLREAAEQVPDVRAGSCRVSPPGTRTQPARGPVVVRLDITVALGRDLPDVTRAVREAVSAAARDRLGLDIAELHVTVTDLHDRPDRPQGMTT